MSMADFNLIRVLDDLQKGYTLEKNEIKNLLGLLDPKEISLLFEAARNVRTRYFGTRVFLYGFLYFSTHCRNECRFCQYRHSNKSLDRYRKTKVQILSAALEMADAGVDLIDLTMGEDPALYSSDGFGFKSFVCMVKEVLKETGLPVMISPGTLPDKVLAGLAHAGVTWYACYQETHNKALYKILRQGQGFKKRIAKKERAKSLGMLIEEGILTGVGETLDDLADSIIWMRDFPADQARVMTFIPQKGTPMGNTIPQDNLRELIIIAVMRLVFPDRLIPASLDIDGLFGLEARLSAGANVVTSIVPPGKGLAGVANSCLDIEDSRRSLAYILPVLKKCGLDPALPGEYRAWTEKRQAINGGTLVKSREMAC